MKKFLLFLLLLVALFVSAGLFLPAQVHVERSIAISRPAATIFALLNSYRSFNQWSPWAALDPEAVYHFSGPEAGVGARMEWSGDPALVGTGWQEITESIPYRRVGTHLDFGPQGRADAYFNIDGDQMGSRVTWGFDTDVTDGQSFIGALLGRYFGLMLDSWVGADYEKGLAALKAHAESLPARDFSDADIQVLQVEPEPVLFVSGEANQDAREIASALADAYGEVMAFVTHNKLEIAGQPMAITRSWEGGRYIFDAAIPVLSVDSDALTGNVQFGQSPGGQAARIVHTGSYATTDESYEQLAAYMAAHGWQEGETTWEHYISDPGETPEAEVITHIYFQIAEDD